MLQKKLIFHFQHCYHKHRLSRLSFQSKGENVQISVGFKFSYPENITIGNNVYIGPQAIINALGGLTIGNGTIIGPRLIVYTANHRFRDAIAIPYDDHILPKKVEIGENIWIGSNVIIAPGAKIGEGSIVAAGAVVTKCYPPFSILGGNPAKVIGARDEEHYMQLKKDNKIYLAMKKMGLMVPHVESECEQ